MAAAQGDVVIDIEERPIVKTEVSNDAVTKCRWQYFSRLFFLIAVFFVCFFSPTLQLQAEKVRFSPFMDYPMTASLKILSLALFSIV